MEKNLSEIILLRTDYIIYYTPSDTNIEIKYSPSQQGRVSGLPCRGDLPGSWSTHHSSHTGTSVHLPSACICNNIKVHENLIHVNIIKSDT
jgi:hypothetical protein